MQPEQQNPDSSYPPSSSGSNIPEYLNMEPVALAPQKSNKKGVIVIIAILLLVGAGFAALIYMQMQTSPEQRFYQMLDISMNTSYVKREIISSAETPTYNLSINAVSDFSKPATPSSVIDYSYLLHDKSTDDASQKITIKGEEIFQGDTSLKFKFSTLPSSGIKDIQAGQWYEVSQSDKRAVSTYDLLGLESIANTPFVHMPIGNFGEDKARQIIEYIKAAEIYKIEDSASEMLDGKQTTALTISTSKQKTADLVEMAALLFNTTPPPNSFFNLGDVSAIKVWIDNDTNQLVKESFQIKREPAMTIVTKFSYPDNFSKPATAGIKEILSNG